MSRIIGTTGSTTDRNYSIGTSRVLAPMTTAYTTPRAIWASIGEQLVPDANQSLTDQFGASRVRTRIAGGKWLALAPVFIGGYFTGFKSPIGVTNTPAYTVSFVLELANGTQVYDYTSPNTGGTLLPGKFNGNTDGVVKGGDIVVGDFIYASDAGLSYFEFPNRLNLPWIRCAFSKTSAGDNIGAVGQQTLSYNYPSNSHWATCTSYANAKTLINTVSISNYNGGNDKWGASDSVDLPSCIGFIGIPMDGQKAAIFFGTSIVDGDGQVTHAGGGVNPANETVDSYNLFGYPLAWGQHTSRSIPVLNFGIGASAMGSDWSDVASDISWSTNQSISLSRLMQAKLVGWFDLCVAHDVHNDNATGYSDVVKNFTNVMRQANPKIKLVSCKVPNGYVDISGTTQGYSVGLDTKWNIHLNMVSSGYWDAQISCRDVGVDIYPDLGIQYSGTTTASGTTTSLTDSNATWLVNQWVHSWVKVGGVKQEINGNTRTGLGFNAFASPVGSGVAYTIEGNCSYDGTHPNMTGQYRMASNFDTAISALMYFPKFVRT